MSKFGFHLLSFLKQSLCRLIQPSQDNRELVEPIPSYRFSDFKFNSGLSLICIVLIEDEAHMMLRASNNKQCT